MFVGERMSRPVISVSPETPVHDALAMFKKEHIRRAPVIKDGKLLGIVTENNLHQCIPLPCNHIKRLGNELPDQQSDCKAGNDQKS